MVLNQAIALQGTGMRRHTDTAHAKHVGEELMRDVKAVWLGAVLARQCNQQLVLVGIDMNRDQETQKLDKA